MLLGIMLGTLMNMMPQTSINMKRTHLTATRSRWHSKSHIQLISQLVGNISDLLCQPLTLRLPINTPRHLATRTLTPLRLLLLQLLANQQPKHQLKQPQRRIQPRPNLSQPLRLFTRKWLEVPPHQQSTKRRSNIM